MIDLISLVISIAGLLFSIYFLYIILYDKYKTKEHPNPNPFIFLTIIHIILFIYFIFKLI